MLSLLFLLVAQGPTPASQPAFHRQSAPPSDKAKALLAWGRRIGAKGATVVNPPKGNGTALDSFFASLDALARGDASDRVDIIAFGNSLISADNVTNVVRERLQERFGDGGRGLVLADRIADYGNRLRSGYAQKGAWNAFNLAMGPRGRGHFGVGAVFHESSGPAVTEWRLNGEQKAELFWLDHKEAPAMELRADGETIAKIDAERSGVAKSLKITLPDGTKRLMLVTRGPKAVVFGIGLEHSKPGVVLDTIGIPAAEASTYLAANTETTAAQLLARHPKLVMFMLGGNEIRRLSWARAGQVEARKTQLKDHLLSLIDRVMQNAQGASCLVVGPIDAVYGASREDMKLKTRPQVADLVSIEREAAAAKDCAFFDLYEAMGGKGSLERFFAQGWIHEDLVHPKGKGLDILGELLSQALLEAYVATPLALARAE